MSKKIVPRFFAFVVMCIAVGFVGVRVWSQLHLNWSNQARAPLSQSLLSLPDRSHIIITVGDQPLQVELVVTPASITQGLSDRSEIGSDGMLFVFEKKEKVGFWMKKMVFDLDIVWIQDNKVVAVTADIPHPDTRSNNPEYLPVYYPPQPINVVLELPAGYAQKHRIISGAEVTFRSML